MLTAAEKHHFETLGFLCLRGFFPADELQRYTDAFDETLKRAKGHQDAGDKRREKDDSYPPVLRVESSGLPPTA